MTYSYWEIKSWFSNIDFTVIGSGIVGLNCALNLKEKFPEKNILILEKGELPQGASTKNAGFACFGSLSEIKDDLNFSDRNEIVDLIIKRVEGLKLLRTTLGDKAIDYQCNGGYELFLDNDSENYQNCLESIPIINDILSDYFKAAVFSKTDNKFQFANICEKLIYNPFEGQIDTGKMMDALLFKAYSSGIKILNNCSVEAFEDVGNSVEVKCSNISFKTNKLFIATNGFASQLGIEKVKPARAQVLITKPIKDLKIKGTFHINKGYYYFRNIDDRILFGGGRELDFEAETTTEFGLTELVQHRLVYLLKSVILPGIEFEIDQQWSGIMGVGNSKYPILESISNNIFCGVKLGGMGIAIGSLVGKELADFV